MLRVNGFATVGAIKSYPEYSFAKVKVTATGVSKSGAEYTDFKGYITLMDNAYEKSVDLNIGDSIKILDLGITTSSKNGNFYTNVNVKEMEIIHNDNATIDTPEELPFS